MKNLVSDVPALVLALILVMAGVLLIPVESAGSGVRTTAVVFAQAGMDDPQWRALLIALEEAAAAEGISREGEVVWLRGDTLKPGIEVERPISIYLHGRCRLEPQQSLFNAGEVLGWVYRKEGRIEPYVHVDCGLIARMLGPSSAELSRSARNEQMAQAIAQVILHELIHIASQSPHHAGRGISKAQFGVADLEPRKATPKGAARDASGSGR